MSDALKRLVSLAQLMVDKQNEIDAIERQLKDDKEALRMIEREDLPMLMAEVGMNEFKLEDGSSVAIKEEVSVAITEANKPEAHKWLIDHGFGGLIKTGVKVEFAAGELDNAIACAEKLAQDYERVEVGESVHPSTLKSFVKEQLQEGKAIPFDLFGVFPYSVAKVTPPKKTPQRKVK